MDSEFPPVLDVCCGSRMFWFDKHDDRALYLDKRRETHVIDKGTPGTKGRQPIVVDPDMVADFTDLPFPDNTFSLVVFDPPHIRRETAKGILTKKYGQLNGDWQGMLRDGFSECFRVLRPNGTLVFKWAESEIAVSEVLKLTNEKPLFGHKSGKVNHTHWICFLKSESNDQEFTDFPSVTTNTVTRSYDPSVYGLPAGTLWPVTDADAQAGRHREPPLAQQEQTLTDAFPEL